MMIFRAMVAYGWMPLCGLCLNGSRLRGYERDQLFFSVYKLDKEDVLSRSQPQTESGVAED